MNVKRVARNLLLAFVLISIGFALGQEVALRKAAGGMSAAVGGETVSSGEKVIVTYLRSSFRCITCNLVETLTDDLIRSQFGKQIESGQLEWRTVDYLQDTELARRHNVSGNMLLVVRIEGGKEVSVLRLDRVMELVTDRAGFLAYVRAGIVQALGDEDS